ncbi:hypothetical protein TREMEDRAFT_61630 [Tremella mesenterica DSM 1558]|uniref:uncharacterized protein n=1 Tax=Tremella mesenterica (strain ATCC 24925 / CBS 8224 / DSM 1558 / NBRC 9311 / NRRL Y-6157 / RJB 2259-6 / UBC 559-6) TaxID=578456 RepID=UPI0003F4A2A5|nr:uncharacterized protein TREMEDRAFT_61630 [Tremella mesenterica DSM 1558]EIW69859.1 hypothetical protein TREMEDRAFT_61630 [Tremella mesenterica DSM 1558]
MNTLNPPPPPVAHTRTSVASTMSFGDQVTLSDFPHNLTFVNFVNPISTIYSDDRGNYFSVTRLSHGSRTPITPESYESYPEQMNHQGMSGTESDFGGGGVNDGDSRMLG